MWISRSHLRSVCSEWEVKVIFVTGLHLLDSGNCETMLMSLVILFSSQEVLKELLKTCRAYHEPDAICRYIKCLNISSHIIPSEHIFYR
jgi:hypothetical protein